MNACYGRLSEIKPAYDPTNFSCHQNIRPKDLAA